MSRKEMLLRKAYQFKMKYCSPKDVRRILELDHQALRQEICEVFEELGGTHMVETGEREVLEGTEQFNRAWAGYLAEEQWTRR